MADTADVGGKMALPTVENLPVNRKPVVKTSKFKNNEVLGYISNVKVKP